MADCNKIPTIQDVYELKQNSSVFNEVVTSPSPLTPSKATDGKNKTTLAGLDKLASDQRAQFEDTFVSQFTYKRIGNISDYVGQELTDSERLNAYQYPDDSGDWYGAIQSQTFPITIPAKPDNLANWSLVSSPTKRDLSRILETSLGVNARIWPKDAYLQVGDVVPSEQETLDGLPITHLVVNGAVYSMTPLAHGLVTDLTGVSVTVGGVSVTLNILSMTDLKEQVLDLENRTDNLEISVVDLDSHIENIEIQSVILKPRHQSGAEPFVNGKRGCILLGDSISHGAFAGDLYSNGYTRLLARAYNAKFGGGSYGFIPLLNIGSGDTLSRDVHNVNFNNSGGGWQSLEAGNGSNYINGLAFKSVGANNAISVNIPSFMRRAVIHYEKAPGGGSFTVNVNGVDVSTINTNQAQDSFATFEVAANDNQYGATTITITTTNANPVVIIGFSWFSTELEPVLQNFSQSGRKVRYLSNSVITKACENSQCIVFALGHNDHLETDSAYINSVTSTVDFLISEAVRYGVNVVVPDFCWSAPASNWMRVLLKKLAVKTGGAYIDFPTLLANPDGSPASSNRLINELKLFVDGSHPNIKGNDYIFSEIAKVMGLTNSKKGVLTSHDYWLSLPLKTDVGVENAVTSTPSAVKRTPDGVVVRLYVEYAPGNPFPQGNYVISNGYAARSGIFGTQTTAQALMKLDATSIIGGVLINPNGQMTLNVTSPAVYNDIVFTGNA